MDLKAYQEAAKRTAPPTDNHRDALSLGGLGVTGEAGEVADVIKKHLYHDHPLDVDKLVEEMGDVVWYVAYICNAVGVPMEAVIAANIGKLTRRYPGGFSSEASINRVA